MAQAEPVPSGWHETAHSISLADLRQAVHTLAVALSVDPGTDPAELMREAAARLSAPAGMVPVTLVPVEVFAAGLCGQHCEHCETHEGYGLSDAVSSWSDCNRAAGRIYRVEDMDGLHRDPGDTVQVWVRAEDRGWFEKRFGDEGGDQR